MNRSVRRWVNANLLSTPLNSAITVAMLAFLALTIPPLVKWMFIDAVYFGSDRSACGPGACWAFIESRLDLFFYGRYTRAERWRVDASVVVLALFVAAAMWRNNPRRTTSVLLLVTLCPLIVGVLLVGGVLGLPLVPTDQWGGLTLNVVITFATVTLALPLGVLLALGRRSALPVIRWLSVGFIEIWRGVPLLTVLFMAMVMLPMFLPAGMTLDRLIRAILGLSLFVSAYMAEVVRGGLQGIPRGQYEASAGLGLGYWATHRLVVLPQAFRLIVPGIVNTVIDLFKDTTLVSIIGLFDVLGIIGQATKDPAWLGMGREGYIFAAFIFFVCCFAMSLYGQSLERANAKEKH
jgi:general L-amino acid transport system permease protein